MDKQIEKFEFRVIDNNTGEEADIEEIAFTEDWAEDLIYCDMEGFAILEDGNLVLLDECGNCAYCPNGRFSIIPEGAVVLTREEYKRQQKDNEDFDEFARSISDIRMKNGDKIATFKDLQDYIELQVKQGSKETAEKFAQALENRLDSIDTILHEDNEEEYLSANEIGELIDEICKEITEGKKND